MVPILWLPEEERRSYWRTDFRLLRKPRRRLERKARCLIATFLAVLLLDIAIVLLLFHLLGEL